MCVGRRVRVLVRRQDEKDQLLKGERSSSVCLADIFTQLCAILEAEHPRFLLLDKSKYVFFLFSLAFLLLCQVD